MWILHALLVAVEEFKSRLETPYFDDLYFKKIMQEEQPLWIFYVHDAKDVETCMLS